MHESNLQTDGVSMLNQFAKYLCIHGTVGAFPVIVKGNNASGVAARNHFNYGLLLEYFKGLQDQSSKYLCNKYQQKSRTNYQSSEWHL